MADSSATTFWKWLAGCLTAMVVSNCATALVFRTSAEQIRTVISDSFLELSESKSMYAIEGRPRLTVLERRYEDLHRDMLATREAISRDLSSLGVKTNVVESQLAEIKTQTAEIRALLQPRAPSSRE